MKNEICLGTKKLEYRGQQFHEHCFTCFACSQPIGIKSFIPKDQKSYCVPCYEEHFATKCTRCSKVWTIYKHKTFGFDNFNLSMTFVFS
jgi:hypothetical protein